MGSIARIDPNPPSKYQQHLSSGCFPLSEPNWIKIPGNQTKFRPSDKPAARQDRRETSPSRDKSSQPRIHTFILILFKFGARSSKSDRETYMAIWMLRTRMETDSYRITYERGCPARASYPWVQVTGTTQKFGHKPLFVSPLPSTKCFFTK